MHVLCHVLFYPELCMFYTIVELVYSYIATLCAAMVCIIRTISRKKIVWGGGGVDCVLA